MNIVLIIVYAICAVYVVLNFKYDLQMFQQNSYRIPRYWKWLVKSQNYGSYWRLADMACFMLVFSVLLNDAASAILIAILAIVKIIIILKKKYKKPLVFTKRVWRLYSLSSLLALGASLTTILVTLHKNPAIGYYSNVSVCLGTILLCAIFSWAIVILADIILIPVERLIRNRYINDARRILRSMPDLKIIGITGSYGKTSTKHYLSRILAEKYDVLMTPGSFNTPMGVVRTIREYMKPYNEVFICEMGAKQIGDIKEICDIVNPSAGLVTAVGPMHLESFKTIENVCKTKFELIDSLPADGLAVINNDFEMCANRPVENVTALRYGVTNTKDCDYYATDVKYTSEGTTFVVNGPDQFTLPLSTKLLGECNVSDLLGAVVIALKMGVEPAKIAYAVSTIAQVEHRLSIRRTPGQVTIIDDAFNSNPAGSKMAVDVLAHFTGGKRIIITPGMIELGERQEELNEALGKYIGESLDIAIVVGAYNRDSIVKGIKSANFNEDNLYIVDSFNEAQKVLATFIAPGDTVLYENDLPDTFK